MISILLQILLALSAVVALVSFLIAFLPYITSYFSNSIQFIVSLVSDIPDWCVPYVSIALVLAVLSLGVKLL